MILLLSCKKETTRFELVSSKTSGIDFINQLALTDTFNILDYMYFFNGGGIAAGDINNDGLIDLYFSGNLVSGSLYLNRGNLRFKNITEKAGVATTGWGSGVSMCDINQDGWLDIYVCQSGYPIPEKRKNLLFINQGNSTFKEEGEAYGLADTSYTTHATFFDFDRDGDLDVYLLNHDHQFRGTNSPLPKKLRGESATTDKLFENRPGPEGHPVFHDISKQAGITLEGFGLGVSIADINNDQWPDIYISNDFISNDILYLNQKNGSFQNVIDSVILHQSYNGMGNDLADVNNDGLTEIYVADMLPYLNSRRKMMAMNTSEDLFDASVAIGYAPQYTRNTLQLNNGIDQHKGNLIPFSEIGQMLGVHSTDWSWSPVFGDVDNDGWKDLYISNGYYRDITDLDFITYRRHRSAFNSRAAQDSLYISLLQDQPSVEIPNFIYHNIGGLNFADSTNAWGLGHPSLSNGALLVDLDNDGDLDIITNNLDQEAFLFENKSSQFKSGHYLKLTLKGPDRNRNGIGTRIYLYQRSKMQFAEVQLSHGYLCSVNMPLHFGLGVEKMLDSLVVIWPDGSWEKKLNPPVDTLLNLNYNDAGMPKVKSTLSHSSGILFEDVTGKLGLEFIHRENLFQDFKHDRNLPYRLSHEGPAVAVGDVTGDGLDDIFLGGAAGFPAFLFIQDQQGGFYRKEFPFHPEFEDVDALVFDADLDGDQDLYVVSGGIEFRDELSYRDRFYRNQGKGVFSYDVDAIPGFYASGSRVEAADYDEDGDLDLLVCTRVIPGLYGADAQSYLLENQGGFFRDITGELAPDLQAAGMVTDAIWTDINQDEKLDFILVGEWMPVTFYLQSEDGFRKQEIILSDSTNSSGWWQSIIADDFDNDGDPDLVIGNQGRNTDMKIDSLHPATLYLHDFDDNGSTESLISYYQLSDGGELIDFPGYERDAMIEVIPSWKKNYVDYRSYAYATTSDLIQDDSAPRKRAYHQESAVFINEGGKFRMIALPVQIQISVVRDVLSDDFDQDGKTDLLVAGNNHETKVTMGYLDASLGTVLMGSDASLFDVLKPSESHFLAGGNVRKLERIKVGENMIYLVIRNGDRLSAYHPKIRSLE